MSRPAAGVPGRLASPQFRRPSRAVATVPAAEAEVMEPLAQDDDVAGADFGFGFEPETVASIRTRDSALVPAPPPGTTGDPAVESTFGRARELMREAIKEPGEKANLLVLQAILDTVLDLIPLAESKYRENNAERAAYALNVYLNQAREIMNDMRSVHDFSQVGFKIVELVAHYFTLIAQNMMTEYSRAQQLLAALPPEHREIAQRVTHELVQVQGRYLNESLKSLRDAVMMQFMTPVGPAAQRKGGSPARR